MNEELKTVDVNADANEHATTTDPTIYNHPNYVSHTLEFNNDDVQSSSDDAKSNVENSNRTVEGKGNTRALDDDEPTYKLETFKKNAMIIFSQYRVYKHKTHRDGTKEDGKNIKKTFQKFGFEGKEYLDFTKEQILMKLDKFSSMDFTNYGCVVIVVLTHGGENGLLKAKDRTYYEKDILDRFKREEKTSLVNKPIVLIIQACRGNDDSTAVNVGCKTEYSEPNKVSNVEGKKQDKKHYYLQLERDTIVLHSSSSRKASHRQHDGTWFIKALCDAIKLLSTTHDLESIMTEVKKKVAIGCYEDCWNVEAQCNQKIKQMPVVTSRLARKLYLRKFGDEPPQHNLIVLNYIDYAVSAYPPPGQSPAVLRKRYQYMRNILQLYANNKNDTTAQFLLRMSASNKTNCDTNSMQMTLVAMSNYIKDKFRNSSHKDYILYYKIL